MNLDWAGVLAQFGEYPAVVQLPAVVKCPRCRQLQLYIYEDAGLGGPWTSCASCDLHGDMIELASSCWKLDHAATLLRLIECRVRLTPLLLQPTGQRDANLVWERRKRITKLITGGRQALLDGAHPTALQALLRVTHSGTMDRHHRERVAELMFTATREQFHRTFGAINIAKVPQLLMPSEGWQDVLAIPHHDLPGRVTGLTLFSESADGRLLHGFYPITRHGAGLGNLFVWHDKPLDPFNDKLFVTPDPALYLQMQVRHLQNSSRRLPLVLSVNTPQSRTESIGKNLQPRPVVIVGKETEVAELLRLARLCNGDVVQHDLQDKPPHAPKNTLYQLSKSVCPWQALLSYKLLCLDVTAAACLMRHIEMNGNELAVFAKQAATPVRERLEQMEMVNDKQGVVVIGDKNVRFDPHGWYHGDVCICDVDVRLERRVFLRNGRSCYVGSVVRGDQSWPITLRVTTGLCRNFFQIVTSEMAAVGEVVNTNKKWSMRGLQIALAAHPPVDYHGIDQVGWDERAGVMRLPQCTLGLGGKVTIGDATAFPAKVPVPAANFAPPGIQAGSDFLEIENQSARGMIWAIMVGILQNVAAPILNMPPEGVAITGDGGLRVGNKIVEALGSPRLSLSKEPMPVERLADWLDHHRWPLHLDAYAIACQRTTFHNWLDLPGDKNAVVSVNWVSAYALATRGWQVIECDPACDASAASLKAAARIMLGYLQDLCRRNGRPRISMADANETVLSDLSAWSREVFGEPIPLKTIRSLTPYGKHVPAWHGFIAIVEHGATKSKPSRNIRIITEHSHAIWVDFKELMKVLDWDDAPQLDFAAVSRSLRETGAMLSERSPDGARGWMLNRDWWERHYARYRANRTAHYSLPIAN